LKIANDFKVPLIADEVYYGIVFDDDVQYESFGNLTKDVPIIVINLA
jgi:aspartate/methionine/tyrosine aminotransferase